jgi:FAD/FMN-containing dehydrogenase
LIARCADVADVIAAVNFGRDSKLAIAIRGGGHNGPGFGSVDEGLVIDLSMMKGVRVDPANQTVRVGAPVAQRAMLTTPPMPSVLQSHSASSRQPELPA